MQKAVIRLALGVGLLLLIPLALTLTGSGVDGQGWHWTPGDFVFAFAVLFGAGLAYLLIAQKMPSGMHRVAVGLAVLASLMLVWVNAAVGIIGHDEWPNLLYFGVLAIGAIGAALSRFQPQGMSRALLAMAAAQMAVPVIVLVLAPQIIMVSRGALETFVLNAFFALLFAGSAMLFRHAAARTVPRS